MAASAFDHAAAAREVASSLIGEALLLAATGATPARMGNDHPRMAPHGVYPAQGEDCCISIAVGTDAEWQALAQVIGAPQLADDARFAAAPGRHAHRAELDRIVAQWSATLPTDRAVALLQAAGVPAHTSWTLREIVTDAHLRARRAIVDVSAPDGRSRAAVGVPMRMSKGEEIGITRGTPRLGEHENFVFGDLLGLTLAERQALQDEQVIH